VGIPVLAALNPHPQFFSEQLKGHVPPGGIVSGGPAYVHGR
jgi:hypothetical protein